MPRVSSIWLTSLLRQCSKPSRCCLIFGPGKHQICASHHKLRLSLLFTRTNLRCKPAFGFINCCCEGGRGGSVDYVKTRFPSRLPCLEDTLGQIYKTRWGKHPKTPYQPTSFLVYCILLSKHCRFSDRFPRCAPSGRTVLQHIPIS